MSSPTLLSIILADDIRREASGQYTYVGTYLDVRLDHDAAEDRKSVFLVSTIAGLKKGEHVIGLTVKDLSGGHSFESEGEIYESEGEESIALIIQELAEFYFPSSGRYEFTLSLNGEEFATLPLRVRFPQGEAFADIGQSGGRKTKEPAKNRGRAKGVARKRK
ncbi:MAG: hypothetical protein IE921_13940 [Rhodobacteraceae bacterium]|nr:hypothetical protein [Paracoccaceae bacterium]